MEKTNVIVGGSNVNGNIGSCEIKSTNFYVSSWYKTTTAINSCTGEIISNNTYFDYSIIYIPFVVVFVISMILLFIKNIFD